MYYERIIISGCTRFSVSGRYHIDLKPTAKVQMILGTNGSGKTTLAQLGFSPLPINHKWMRKDGYFIKEGTYKGDRYKLSGKYSPKPSYTFIKNDEVLLEEGNATTYLDLVRVHLNYTPWLHDLLIGKVKFTELGPGQRQDFLSRISNSDFTQAFKMLNNYKKQHSHQMSIVKFLNGRVNEEEVKLLGDKELEVHKSLRVELQKELEAIQSIPSLDIEHLDLNQAHRVYKERLDKYLGTNPVSPLMDSTVALREFYELNEQQLSEQQGQLNLVTNELTQLTQKLGFIDSSEDNKSELVIELKALSEEVKKYETLPGNIPVEYYTQNPNPVIEALRYSLSHMSTDPLNPSLEHELRNKALEKDTFLSRCETRLEQVMSELQRVANIESIKCPSCSHEFKPGIDPNLLKELNERREVGSSYVEQSVKDKTVADTDLEEYLAKKKAYDELEFIKSKYKDSHRGLFTYLDSIGGFSEGKKLVSHLHTYSQFCDAYHRKMHLVSNIDRLASVAKKVDEMEKEKTYLSELLKEKSDFFNSLTSKRDVFRSNVALAKNTIKDIDDEEKEVKHILGLADSFYRALDNQLEVVKQDIKKETLDDVLGRLAVIHNTLNEQEIIQSLVKDFKSQLDVAKKKVLITKEIVDALSPKDGLIAEQLTLTIGGFLKGLNQLVDKVWGYPLEVRLGQVGDNGLDYKFPMSDTDQERDDVSEGSDSMLEMMNRAVVMMAYFSLDLNDMPLFLDEPGRTFDKTHELNLIPLIRDLTDSVRFSQIVLISHSEDVQTAFPNSETLILDDRNIKYPHPYNNHVSFDPAQEL